MQNAYTTANTARRLNMTDDRMPQDERTDENLMVLLRQGVESALAELVSRYQRDIYRFCLHYIRDATRAQDLAQETFLRVYAARGRFDPEKRFRPWVLCIARNLCLNEIKRGKIAPMESLEALLARSPNSSAAAARSLDNVPHEQAIAAERREILARALDSLDDDAREIVVLKFFQKRSAREIADVIGSTEGAVRTRLHRILRSLREQCGQYKHDV